MKIAYDLHIHTALSPCASDEMTPNNIVNMALLKELDAIAIADHNSSENCRAVMEVAKGNDIQVIPSMELQTSEEVHLLCLFNTICDLLDFQKIVDKNMIIIPNKPAIFGNQWIMNKEDLVVGEKEHMLLSSSGLSLDKTVEIVKRIGGVVIPAHIDRGHNSIIVNLGFIPEKLNFRVLEIYHKDQLEPLKSQYDFLKKYQYIFNSDAHQLGAISEPEHFLEVEEKSVRCIIQSLKDGKGV